MTRQEMWNYIKEHKKQIIIGTIAAVGTGALIVLGVKKKSNAKSLSVVSTALNEDIDIHLDTATVTEAWKEGGFINLILNDFKCKDIGELGKDLAKNIPEITEDTTLTCIIGSTAS